VYVYLATEGFDRLFGLDLQLLADSAIEALAIFVLFLGMSYLLFNPARELLKKRQEKIDSDMAQAAKDKEEAAKLSKEYTEKLGNVNKEAEAILSETRKKAQKKENEIIAEAKAEAVRIRERADKEIELEKNKVKDEVKQEMILVASLMAGKVAAASMDKAAQAELIENTLKEMGDETWQS
jgi:F-type H+-transporting ATPase subunit b